MADVSWHGKYVTGRSFRPQKGHGFGVERSSPALLQREACLSQERSSLNPSCHQTLDLSLQRNRLEELNMNLRIPNCKSEKL